MSVINQMLQDLEQRHAAAGQTLALPGSVRSVPHPRRLPWGWAALGGALTALAVSGYQLLHAPAGPPTEAPLHITQPRVQAPSPIVTPPQPAASTPAAPQPQATAPESAGLAQISDGLKLADRLAALPPTAAGAPASERGPAEPAPTGTASATAPAPAPVAASKAGAQPSVAAPAKPRAEAPAKTVTLAIRKEVKEQTPGERAAAEFGRGSGLLAKGRIPDAMAAFSHALELDPRHDPSRHALAGLLIEQKRTGDAARLLEERLAASPDNADLAMLLARIQVEQGRNADALSTLRRSLSHAQGRPDYHGFMAALLQREARHDEAAAEYLAALEGSPRNGVWLMGLGLSLEPLGRATDAAEAYRRALAADGLSPDLRVFVEQRLRQVETR